MKRLKSAVYNSIYRQDGMTLVELLAALAILAMVIAPFLSNFLETVKIGRLSKSLLSAEYVAQYILEQAKQNPPDVSSWDAAVDTNLIVDNSDWIDNYTTETHQMTSDGSGGTDKTYRQTYTLSNGMYVEMDIIDKAIKRDLGTTTDPNKIELKPEIPKALYTLIPRKNSTNNKCYLNCYDGDPRDWGGNIPSSPRAEVTLDDKDPPAASIWLYPVGGANETNYELRSMPTDITPTDGSQFQWDGGYSKRLFREYHPIPDDGLVLCVDFRDIKDEWDLPEEHPPSTEKLPLFKLRVSNGSPIQDDDTGKKIIIYENDPTDSLDISMDEAMNRGYVEFVRGFSDDPEDEDDVNSDKNYYWVVINVYKNADKRLLLSTTDSSLRKK